MVRKASVIVVCLLVGLLVAGAAFAGGQGDKKGGKPVTLVVSIRGLDNPYHANYKNGADALGKQLGLPVDTLSTEANSEKGIADIKAEVAKTGGNMVLNLDPNQAPDVVPIAKILETAGVYWVNWWNKPDDVKVWDYPHWVAHITFDSVGTGLLQREGAVQDVQDPEQGQDRRPPGHAGQHSGDRALPGSAEGPRRVPGREAAAVGRLRLGQDQGLQRHQGHAGRAPGRRRHLVRERRDGHGRHPGAQGSGAGRQGAGERHRRQSPRSSTRSRPAWPARPCTRTPSTRPSSVS